MKNNTSISNTLRLIWNDWYKIIGDNCHIMPVNGELLNALRSGVDQTEPMDFPWTHPEVSNASVTFTFGCVSSSSGYGAIVIVPSLDEVIVGQRSLDMTCEQSAY